MSDSRRSDPYRIDSAGEPGHRFNVDRVDAEEEGRDQAYPPVIEKERYQIENEDDVQQV